MIYDVSIIGGGLAGLSLAIDLRMRGLEVLLIEKGSYPRHKVCGEYISMESHDYLHRLCPDLNKLSLPYITHFHLSSTQKRDFKTTLDLGGFGISRYLLEDLLYQQSLKIGVAISLNNKVLSVKRFGEDTTINELKTSNETFLSKMVCNATGRKSNLKSANKDIQNSGTNYVGVKYHVKRERNEQTIEIHNFPGGYCGSSNIEDGKTCICYIVNASKLKESNASIPEMEKQFLFKNRHIKEVFETSEFLYDSPLTISGINFNIQESSSNEAYFLGDSAGKIAPVTGNGMSMALRSSWFLAEKIEQYFNKHISREELSRQYAEFWDREFSKRVKLSRYFQKLSKFPVLSNLSISMFNVFPKIANPLIRASHGKPF